MDNSSDYTITVNSGFVRNKAGNLNTVAESRTFRTRGPYDVRGYYDIPDQIPDGVTPPITVGCFSSHCLLYPEMVPEIENRKIKIPQTRSRPPGAGFLRYLSVYRHSTIGRPVPSTGFGFYMGVFS
jgi:hypothetical protein